MHVTEGYIRGVRKLAGLKRSPDTATAVDLRRFLLHIVETGIRATDLRWHSR